MNYLANGSFLEFTFSVTLGHLLMATTTKYCNLPSISSLLLIVKDLFSFFLFAYKINWVWR